MFIYSVKPADICAPVSVPLLATVKKASQRWLWRSPPMLALSPANAHVMSPECSCHVTDVCLVFWTSKTKACELLAPRDSVIAATHARAKLAMKLYRTGTSKIRPLRSERVDSSFCSIFIDQTRSVESALQVARVSRWHCDGSVSDTSVPKKVCKRCLAFV